METCSSWCVFREYVFEDAFSLVLMHILTCVEFLNVANDV